MIVSSSLLLAVSLPTDKKLVSVVFAHNLENDKSKDAQFDRTINKGEKLITDCHSLLLLISSSVGMVMSL